MLHYNRIDVSEITDFNETSASKKCIIFHQQCFYKFIEKINNFHYNQYLK